jgi:TRAP-type C4-dicarboxylate transport system permease small subunit
MIVHIVGAVLCLFISFYSAKATWVNFVEGITFPKVLEVPRAPIMLAIPIGSFLLFIEFLRNAYQYLRMWRGTIEPEIKGIERD